LSGPAMVLDSL